MRINEGPWREGVKEERGGCEDNQGSQEGKKGKKEGGKEGTRINYTGGSQGEVRGRKEGV